ncbi:MAG: contractile injection system tape measure protein [Bacteroidota bacterium]
MEEKIYVHNAGMVLIAPFLPRYYEMLVMLTQNQFNDEATGIRGVCLLEYLVSGRTEFPEHELALNKVLCGLSLSTPIPTQIELTEAEEETSRQLLKTVLQNWGNLKNATIDNLRDSFLLRNGVLEKQEDSWSVQVESAGYDMVLQILPWTISKISLPWMSKRVETTWNNS